MTIKLLFSNSIPASMLRRNLCSFCLFILLPISQSVINLPGNQSIPAVLMFGDSIVDTGNNNYINTMVKVNFPPYGQDFMGGQPTGRFCDGKVPPDFLVEELGIKELLPPYLDPSLQLEDLISGVNFASGGAGFDPQTSQLVTVLSLSDQVELLKEYIEKLKGAVGEERTRTIIANSLYTVVAGSNDITNTYFPFRQLHYDFPTYANMMVSSASTFVQDLYRLGARRIGMFSVPIIGCVPALRTVEGGLQRECSQKHNEAAKLFNTKLSAEIDSLNSKLPNARIVLIDIYYPPLDIIRYPKKYGFEIANLGCCGTGTIEVTKLCKSACTDASNHVFWDSFHLTEKAYGIIVRELVKKYINKFTCANSPC